MPFQPGFATVNNGVVVCGGHVAYYQINFNDLLFKHNGFYGPYGGADVWSYADLGFPVYRASDWILAAVLKSLYSADPGNLTVL